jgi:hypothetical protein
MALGHSDRIAHGWKELTSAKLAAGISLIGNIP